MKISELIKGGEYTVIKAYGQPPQRVKVLNVSEKTCSKWGKYWSVDVVYISEDCTKGMTTSMNTIECEKYLI